MASKASDLIEQLARVPEDYTDIDNCPELKLIMMKCGELH